MPPIEETKAKIDEFESKIKELFNTIFGENNVYGIEFCTVTYKPASKHEIGYANKIGYGCVACYYEAMDHVYQHDKDKGIIIHEKKVNWVM